MVVKQDKVAFEDALRMAGFGKFNILAFLLCSSVFMGVAFEMLSVSYLVPGSVCELNTTSSQQGLIAGVPLIGILATSHIWGYLADTRGRRRILSISLTLGFFSGSIAALSPNWIVLCVMKFCSCASVSGGFALTLTLLSEYTPEEKRRPIVLLTTSVFLAASGIMAVLSIPVLPLKFSYYVPYLNIHFNSWRLLDLIFAFPTALGAIGVACSYESPKYLLSTGQEEEALKVIRKIYEINSGKSGDSFTVNSVILNEESSAHTTSFWSSIKAQTLPMFKRPLIGDSLLLAVLFVVSYICINPFIVWLPFIVNAFIISVENGHSDVTLCEMMRLSGNSTVVAEVSECSMNKFAMTMVFSISIIVSVLNLGVSFITNRVERKYVFVVLQVMCGTASILINLSPIREVSAVLILIYLTGIINFGTLSSFCVDVYPTYVKAMAVCFTLMIGRGSAVVGVNMLKRLLDENCEAAFYIFGALPTVGGLVGMLLPTEKNIAQRKQLMEAKMSTET